MSTEAPPTSSPRNPEEEEARLEHPEEWERIEVGTGREDLDKLTVTVVDISQARRAYARDRADERLNEETTKGGFRGFIAKIWKGDVAREYYREKYTQEADAEIEASGNLFEFEGGRDSRESVGAVVDRFMQDLPDQAVIHSGERRSQLEDDTEQARAFKTGVRELVGRYARSEISEESFEELKNELLASTLAGSPVLLGAGDMFGDNLLEIAKNVKLRAEHGEAVDEIANSLKFVTGEARMGVRTEAHMNRLEKLVEGLSGKHYKIIGGAYVALATAATIGVGRKTLRMGTGAALRATAVFGVGGALIAGSREYVRTKRDRVSTARDMAKGKEFEGEVDESAGRMQRFFQRKAIERRRNIENTVFDTIKAGETIDAINSLFTDESRSELRVSSREEFDNLLSLTADIDQRIRLSDEEDIDLISFTDVTTIEEERTQLDIALAFLKVRLAEAQGEYYEGVSPEDLLAVRTAALEGARDALESDIAVRNRLFNRFRDKEVAKKAAMGAVMGGLVGFGLQETLAILPVEKIPGVDRLVGLFGDDRPIDGSPYNETLAEGMTASGVVEVDVSDAIEMKLPENLHVSQEGGSWTILDTDNEIIASFEVTEDGGLTAASVAELNELGVLTSEATPTSEVYSGAWVTESISENTNIKIPEGYNLQEVNGRWALNDANGNITGEVMLDQDGNLTEASLASLQENGYGVAETSKLVATSTVEEGLSLEEFVESYDTTTIQTTRFWTNDTPNLFDLNELGLHAGGVDGGWFDAEGNVVVDVGSMTEGGSFLNGDSANPYELIDQGQLQFIVAIDDNSPGEVAMFDIERVTDATTGNTRVIATIPKEDDITQLFGGPNEGRRGVMADYIRIGQLTGETTDTGAEEVYSLATFKGRGTPDVFSAHIEGSQQVGVVQLTPTITIEGEPSYDIDLLPYAESVEQSVRPIIPIPIVARTGLEGAGYKQLKRPDNYYYGYGRSPEEDAARIEEMSPRLRDDPTATLDMSEELTWYRGEISTKKGQAYLDSLDQQIESTPELASIPASTRVIVTLPVAAASEQDNIYGVLSLYAQQDDDAVAASTVLLYVNYPDDAKSDDEKRVAIEKTFSEIERARVDFPELRVAVVEDTFDHELPERGQGVIGHIARHMYDLAMMSVEHSIRDGSLEPSSDVLIVRNDADMSGMSPHYLSKMINALDQYSETDSYVGATRWSTEEHYDNPVFGVLVNFKEIMQMLSSRNASAGGGPPTTGTNTVVRMSSLAAIGSIGNGEWMGAGSDDVEIGLRLQLARSRESSSGGGGSTSAYATYSTGTTDEDSDSDTTTSSSGSYIGAGGVAVEPSERQTVKHITAAHVDANGDRLLGTYRSGRPISQTWNSFDDDESGYQSRDAVLSALGDLESERYNLDEAFDRFERNIESLTSDWYNDPAAVLTGLQYIIPYKDSGGERMYSYRWHNGRFSFQFTDAGRTWFKNRLERNSKGQFRPFGNAVRSRLYGERKPGSRIPQKQPPRMVGRVT